MKSCKSLRAYRPSTAVSKSMAGQACPANPYDSKAMILSWTQWHTFGTWPQNRRGPVPLAPPARPGRSKLGRLSSAPSSSGMRGVVCMERRQGAQAVRRTCSSAFSLVHTGAGWSPAFERKRQSISVKGKLVPAAADHRRHSPPSRYHSPFGCCLRLPALPPLCGC